jgi:hypothetical protein
MLHRSRRFRRFLFRLLRAAVAILCAASTGEAQSGRPSALLAPPSASRGADCACPIVLREDDEARTCRGGARLERTLSHASGTGVVCTSLSLIDVEEEPGRCATSGGGASCDREQARPCSARYKFVVAVHANACHTAPPPGFWLTSDGRARLRIYRAVGTEQSFQVVLRPECGGCAEATLTVSLPDGASGGSGTPLYRHQIAADCGSCATRSVAQSLAGSASCER